MIWSDGPKIRFSQGLTCDCSSLRMELWGDLGLLSRPEKDTEPRTELTKLPPYKGKQDI
jgi:hypothetical protein